MGLLWVLPKLLRLWMATTLATYWFRMGLWLCKRKIFQINGSVKNSSIEYPYSKLISNFATVVLGSFICQRNKIFQSQTISKCRIDGKLNVLCMMLVISILHHCSLSQKEMKFCSVYSETRGFHKIYIGAIKRLDLLLTSFCYLGNSTTKP